MAPWQQRVVDEYLSVKDKLDKLEVGISNMPDNAFSRDPEVQRQLLFDQVEAMRNYADVLRRRMTYF